MMRAIVLHFGGYIVLKLHFIKVNYPIVSTAAHPFDCQAADRPASQQAGHHGWLGWLLFVAACLVAGACFYDTVAAVTYSS